jgi:hypothetical protein
LSLLTKEGNSKIEKKSWIPACAGMMAFWKLLKLLNRYDSEKYFKQFE